MEKFIVDRTLGKLARKLRVLGFDVAYRGGGNLEEATRAALTEGRLLLTRSRRMREKVKGLNIFIVEANDPPEQVREVLAKLNLQPTPCRFFSRCLLCNESLLAIPKEEVEERVPDFIYRVYDSFHVCPRCQRIYWPGTHFLRMKKEFPGTTGKD